jgi:hypothetical protein
LAETFLPLLGFVAASTSAGGALPCRVLPAKRSA